jgi:hypothetical protein
MTKEIILRDKYIKLTGNYKKAILLEYFIEKSKKEGDWFKASYSSISKESLLEFTKLHIKKHIDELVEKRWIECRIDPQGGFGSTYQYKVNVDRINKDLEKIRLDTKADS